MYIIENLICVKCESNFFVRPGEEEWQKRTCTTCLEKEVKTMSKKPDWMDQEDWIMSRLESTKENIISGGKMVDKQSLKVEFFKVECTAPFCGLTFFEFEALEYCPHCAAKIESNNEGKSIKLVLEINTKTGKISQNGYEQS